MKSLREEKSLSKEIIAKGFDEEENFENVLNKKKTNTHAHTPTNTHIHIHNVKNG